MGHIPVPFLVLNSEREFEIKNKITLATAFAVAFFVDLIVAREITRIKISGKGIIQKNAKELFYEEEQEKNSQDFR